VDIAHFDEVYAEFVRLLLSAETMPVGPEREIMQQLLHHSRRAMDHSHQLAELRERTSQDIHPLPPAVSFDQ
jgi:hypothetical protein